MIDGFLCKKQKEKNGVDKRDKMWYYNQVAARQTGHGKAKNLKKTEKSFEKGLTNA